MISTSRFYITSFVLAFILSLFWFGKEKNRIGFPWIPLIVAAFWITSASAFIRHNEKNDFGFLELIGKAIDPTYFYSGNDWVAIRGPGTLAMFSIAVFSAIMAWLWTIKNYVLAKRKEKHIKSLQTTRESRRV